MARQGGKQDGSAKVSLPRDALKRIDIGQSFAEYDPVLFKPGVFVTTPAVETALNGERAKCFFVGRRGTGKTAITRFLSSKDKLAVQIHPQIFEPMEAGDTKPYQDTRQRPFRSLVFSFKRALICEAVSVLIRTEKLRVNDFPESLEVERESILNLDFDTRFLMYVAEYQKALADRDQKAWLALTPKADALGTTVVEEFDKKQVTFLIDRIDEAWDGSDMAVIYLMALMHACVELTASCKFVRPRLFLRENIFERVRTTDNEFARLETGVVSLEWTRPLLREFVERRLVLPFNTKPPLGGPTWDHFFESSVGKPSQDLVFEYCQDRPRDVLTYCGLAIESAQGQRHEKITIEDLQAARMKFSESRIKDLGDEYAENYPQIQLVLSRFFGLGIRFTMPGITSFIRKLLADDEIKKFCGSWLFRNHMAPEQFVNLLYGIGFMGITDGSATMFRSVGAQTSTPPQITSHTTVSIHPSYVDALRLQDKIIGDLPEGVSLKESGIVADLPDAIDLNDYNDRLQELIDDLASLPLGTEAATRFEDIVGDVIRLCFFKSLTNVEAKSRNHSSRVIRDWVAANRAQHGFWEMVRQRYGSTQVIWECKNYEDLGPDDFRQVADYMGDQIGRFSIIVFRGAEIKNHYYEHIKRTTEKSGLVILLRPRDLNVFLRQAKAGKDREQHLHEIYDATVRNIS